MIGIDTETFFEIRITADRRLISLAIIGVLLALRCGGMGWRALALKAVDQGVSGGSAAPGTTAAFRTVALIVAAAGIESVRQFVQLHAGRVEQAVFTLGIVPTADGRNELAPR